MRDHDFAREVARSVQPPRFESLSAQARSRRRRRAAGGLVVAAVVVLAIALGGALAGEPDSVGPVAPTPTPAPAHDRGVERTVRTGSLISVAASPGGSVLTVWRRCAHKDSGCAGAWQLRTHDGSWIGRAHGSAPMAYRAGNDFVVSSWDHLGVVVGPAGSSTPLHRVRALSPRPGDTFVRSGKGMLIVDPGTGSVAPAPVPPGAVDLAAAAVADDGALFALPALSGPGRVSVATLRGGRWTQQVVSAGGKDGTVPGYLAVSGRQVAAFSSFDGATILPVGVLAVSSDGGQRWTMLAKSALPFDTVDSIAATSDGTLFVATAGGKRLYRSTGPRWTRFMRVRAPRGIGDLEGVGDRVLARGGTVGAPVLLVYDASGHRGRLIRLR